MLLEKLKSDLVSAMKMKNEAAVSTLRFLLSAVNNKQIELQHDLTDEDVISVIAKQVKEHKESIEAYQNAERNDLVDKEKAEMEILSAYMPAQLSEAELENIVKQVIQETGSSNPADFGKVMGIVMGKVKGRADGNIVGGVVKNFLLK